MLWPRLIETHFFQGCRDRDPSRHNFSKDVETETSRDWEKKEDVETETRYSLIGTPWKIGLFLINSVAWYESIISVRTNSRLNLTHVGEWPNYGSDHHHHQGNSVVLLCSLASSYQLQAIPFLSSSFNYSQIKRFWESKNIQGLTQIFSGLG